MKKKARVPAKAARFSALPIESRDRPKCGQGEHQ
jgi:hypothetical protein